MYIIISSIYEKVKCDFIFYLRKFTNPLRKISFTPNQYKEFGVYLVR